MGERRILLVADTAATVAHLAGALEPSVAEVSALVIAQEASIVDTAALPACVTDVSCAPALDWDVPTDALGPALASLVTSGVVVVVDSSQAARDLAGWLTVTTGAAVVWAVDAIRATPTGLELDRVVLGGSHRMVHVIDGDGPVIVIAKPDTAADPRGRSLEVTSLDLQPATARVRVLERTITEGGDVALKGAKVVVSIGRGIGGPEHVALFEQLARELGAALGASRVAVDAGWVSFAHQVGQTGSSVAPDVYLAFGVSGAIQHMAGMRASRCVVAVNTDPTAPLCQIADLVVDGDAVTVAEGLLKRLLDRS